MLLYDDMKNRGRFGDTELAHVNPQEMVLLQALGGSGTINPFTGRPEFFNVGAWAKNAAQQVYDAGKGVVEDITSVEAETGKPALELTVGPLGDITKSIHPDFLLPTGDITDINLFPFNISDKPNFGDQLGLDADLGKDYGKELQDWGGNQLGLDAGLGDHYGLDAGLQEHIEGGGWGTPEDWIIGSNPSTSALLLWEKLLGGGNGNGGNGDGSSSGSSVEGGMTEDQFKEYLFGKMRGEIDTPYEKYDDKKRFADFDPMQNTAFDKVKTFGASTPQEMIDAASAARGETGYKSGYGAETSTSEFAPGTYTSGYAPGTYTSGYAPTDYTSGYTTAGVDPAAFQKEIDARMSPFTGSVINQLQKDITEQQQLALGQTGEQARASGAFGGSRQGVAEGITSGKYADAFGRTAGQLRADQFNRAVAGADVDRQMKERFGQGAYGLTQQARQAKERFDQGAYGLTQQARQAKERFDQGAFGLTAQDRARAETFRQGAFGLTAQDRARAETFRQGAFGQTEQARQAEEAANRLAASTRLAAGSELRTTGQALDDAEARRINALSAAGAQKQQLDQALKDFQYNQFVEGRDWDKSNILAGGGLIGAVPPDDPPVYGREGGILNRFMEILFGKNRQIA